MVETALGVVVLALLFAGALEYGRLISATAVLAEAAREAARTAATTDPASRSSAATARANAAAVSYFPASALTITTTNGTTASGEPIVTVSVTGSLPVLFARLVPTATQSNGQWVVSTTRSATLRDELQAGS